MNDLGKALLDNVDKIIDIWVEEVRRDIDIESTKGLTYESIHNGLPDVLASVATLLTTAFANEEDELEADSLEHGAVRAEQGFEITEVVREYRTLRDVLLRVLEPDLKTGSVPEVLKAVRKIDRVLDDVVLISLECYVNNRLNLLEKMHGQLLLTNQELIRLVHIQKDNVSHLAHELKNPLNAIISFSSILLRKQNKQLTETAADSIEMKQMERILNNGRQLLRLINNTIEASKKESENVLLNVESVSVSPLITTVVEAFDAAAQEKELALRVNCDRAPKQVTTDSLRLQQVLTNLVSNAIRYTDKGTITITACTTDDDQWEISVIDTGRGISTEDQANVFNPYFRAGDEADYIPESSGLGLTIVNKLVQLLQGQIHLTSTLEKGSNFTICLPIHLN